MYLKSKIIAFLLILSTISAWAQQYLGITSSNYAGTNSLYANPANIVNSRYKLYVNLAAADLFIGNNAMKWNAPYSFIKLASGAILPKSKEIWRASYLKVIDNNKEKNLNGLIDVRGPAIMFSIDEKQAIAITSRGRGGISLTNVSPEISELILKGSKAINLTPNGTNQSMALNMNAFTEIEISYGKDISLNAEEAIKVGFSVKRIIGLTNFHFIGKKGDFTLLNNVPDPTGQPFDYDNVLKINTLQSQYGHSNLSKGIPTFSLSPAYWFGSASPGRGLGLDLGLSYEYRPDIQKHVYRDKGVEKVDETQNKYEFKFGVSLVDIGAVRFNNPNFVDNFKNTAINKTFFESGVDVKNNIKNPKTDKKIVEINKTLDVTDAEDLNDFKANLPLTFQAYFDYHLNDKIYVYATWVQNLRSQNNLGMRMPSLVSVVPRYESKWVDIAIPISLLNDYQLLAFGLSARLGPFFIGSDNLQGLLNIGDPKGVNLYTGLNIPIFHKLPSSSTKCYYDAPKSSIFSFLKPKPKKSKKGKGEL
jgi:hypothetical protein